MKRVSTAIMLVGIVMLVLALGSDVAVDGMGGRRITNVGLMHDRLVNTILSVSVILGGLLLKVFGKNLGADGEGYLQAIDRLPRSEYGARLLTTVLASACVWVLVLMYLWPTTIAGALLMGAIGWFTFLPQATYAVIGRVWLATLLLAGAVLAWHVVAIATSWINFLTLGLFSDGVVLVGSGSVTVVLAALVLAPLALSIAGFTVARRKAKRA
ncbi:MAG: hypothetical protein F9K35_01430 [Burkholderiaceae bacterium]|nr:MAG: hypothetical protein F9K35_01430 [Burkholderiaceae bacterium]